jgi:hypothetical protein
VEGLNLDVIDHGGATPPGVMYIEVTHDYGREFGAELGEEICDGMGSTGGIEIVDSECRASWEPNSYSKKGIGVGKNDVSLHSRELAYIGCIKGAFSNRGK